VRSQFPFRLSFVAGKGTHSITVLEQEASYQESGAARAADNQHSIIHATEKVL